MISTWLCQCFIPSSNWNLCQKVPDCTRNRRFRFMFKKSKKIMIIVIQCQFLVKDAQHRHQQTQTKMRMICTALWVAHGKMKRQVVRLVENWKIFLNQSQQVFILADYPMIGRVSIKINSTLPSSAASSVVQDWSLLHDNVICPTNYSTKCFLSVALCHSDSPIQWRVVI